MRESFKLATSGSIVFHATAEKTKYSHEQLMSFSQLQSSFTNQAKTALFPHHLDVPRPKRGGKMDL